MTDNVMKDLKMAEISLAKVADVSQMEKQAGSVLSDLRTNVQVREEVQAALDTIEQRSDYQINLNVVQEVDQVVNKHSNMVVKDGISIISGTEAFGLTLSPAEWRKTRSAALKEILSETHKNIKRWANQLSDNFQRRWVELMTSTEVLEERLSSIDATLNIVDRIVDGITTVELNELISRSVSKGGKVLTGDVSKGVQGEVNYILLCLTAWSTEQIKFKNSVIRYFGNEKNEDITDIERVLPKLFDQRGKVETNEGMLFGRQTRQMLNGSQFEGISLEPKWIKDNIKTVADNTLYAESLSLTGYDVITDAGLRVSKTTMPVMSLSQLYVVRDVVEAIINKLKSLNDEEDPTNFKPDDVKDVLGTLRSASENSQRALQYGLITADYQYNVNNFKTQVSNQLTVLASHLITMMNQHLECYNVE